jgi:hypothetical protein
MKRSYFISTLLICILENIHIILFTILYCISRFRLGIKYCVLTQVKHIELIAGIIFGVFVGPDEHLQVFERQ